MKSIIQASILCTSMMSSLGYATTLSAPSAHSVSPLQLVKDINKLYMNLIMNHLTQKVQTSIICEQIPLKIQQYKNADPSNKAQSYNLFLTLQENIEQTRKSLQISCKK